MNFQKMVIVFHLLSFMCLPTHAGGEQCPTQPIKERAQGTDRYQVFIINWTPNNSVISHTKWWIIEHLLGRRYIHTSLVIAKLLPHQAEAELEVSLEGKILVGSSPFHYLSFPDGNRITAYVPEGTNKRDVLFEAVKISEQLSEAQLAGFFAGMDMQGYYLPPKWREPTKSEDLVDHFRNITGKRYKQIKQDWKARGVFKQKTPQIDTIDELLAPYCIDLQAGEQQIIRDYIYAVSELPHYRSNYNMHTNNCVHSVYFALARMFGPKMHKALGDQNKLSSQALIRRVKQAFPGSPIMRASRSEKGWQLAEVEQFLPQGHRPYYWGGMVLVATGALVAPLAL